MIDETNIIYAPVLITTLCRYEHFVRCIESLKNNTWAKHTDIYIGLDYPQKQSHWDGYTKIINYLEGEFYDFRSFNVVKRTYNYGSLRNMSELREMVFKDYDRIIRTDDDAEFSPNFLEYINKCLMYYEKDENIIGVSGYSYPIEWDIDKEANIFEENFIFPMWGTGLWRDKYREFEKKLKCGYLRDNFNKYLRNTQEYKLTDARMIDYINGSLCWSNKNLIYVVSDISLGIYLTLEKKRIIMPAISKVRNYGFDGTGEYCQNTTASENDSNNIYASNYNYSKQIIDKDIHYNLLPSSNNNLDKNRILMNNFDRRTKSEIKKIKIKTFLYKVFGAKVYEKIWHIKNNIIQIDLFMKLFNYQ